MKKIKINTLGEEFESLSKRFALSFLPDGEFRPHETIADFWEKYEFLEARDILFQLHACSFLFKERINPFIDLRQEPLKEFLKDLQELITAIYYLNEYRSENLKTTIKIGGAYEQ